MKVAEVFVATLAAAGVQRVYGVTVADWRLFRGAALFHGMVGGVWIDSAKVAVSPLFQQDAQGTQAMCLVILGGVRGLDFRLRR